MPWMRCPACRSWSLRSSWRAADGQRVPFRRRCPTCSAVFDVAKVGLVLRLPAGAAEERRMAALALRAPGGQAAA
jgi:hypothetical protein